MKGYKASVKKAIRNYGNKNQKSLKRSGRNKKPEAQLVKLILNLSNQIGLDLHRIESQAVLHPKAGTFLNSQAPKGYPDLSGNDIKFGRACYVEVKAPGRRSTLRPDQRAMLEAKIHQNCFAACVDSWEMLKRTYSSWCKILKKESKASARNYLFNQLPQKAKKKKEDPLF